MRPPSGRPSRADAHWLLAERTAAAVLRRYPAATLAVWAHGGLVHDEDTGAVELTVATTGTDAGPAPSARRIDGVVVSLSVVTAAECLAQALALTPSWPLTADRYVTGRPLHDPDGWHDRLRDTHLGRLAEARDDEFAAAARTAWCDASAARSQAAGLAAWHDTDGAMHALGAARLAAALVDGLLTRTYFRSPADAVARTGTGSVGLTELAARLDTQAATLADRGCPIDGDIDDLLATGR